MPPVRPTPSALHLRVEHLLGEGGSAHVWAVVCAVTGRPEALKLAHERSGEAALLRQHRRAAGRRHPNLVAHLGLTRTDDGALGVRLERAPGDRLGEVVAGLLPEERLEVALGLSAGVAAIHGWRLVHGDLSPENVLVDHGVARLLDWAVDPGDGAGFGTPGYAAPDAVSGELPCPATDVYALGCLLHEVLTGRALWPEGVPGPEPDLDPGLPDAVRTLLADMLSWQSEARPRDAEEVLHRLAFALEQGEARLTELAVALLDDGRPSACDTAQRTLETALDALETGRGAFVSVDVPTGADRARLDAWLCDEAAARGAVPVVASSLAELARALGTSAAASRDPVHALAMQLDAAAASLPRVVVVPASDPDSPVLLQLYETLRTAARAGAVLAVVDGAAQPDASVALQLLDAQRRHAMLHRYSDAMPAVAGHLDLKTPEVTRAVLRVALSMGVLARADGGWVVDGSRPLDPTDSRVAAALRTHPRGGRPLDPVERAVLATLWWAPVAVPVERLAALCGHPAGAVATAVERLHDEALVRATDEVTTRHHARSRMAACALSSPDATALHRRLARWVPAGLDYADRALHAATHRLLADLAPRAEEVLDLAAALAARGRRHAALALLDRIPDGAQVRGLRAEVLVAEGEFERAREVLGACHPGDDHALLVRVAQLERRCGAHREAFERLDLGAPTAAARLELASACLWTGDARRADALAAGLVGAETRASVRAGACHIRSTCAWQSGKPAAAERFALQGLDVAGDDRGLRADLLRALGLACYYQGRHGEARHALAQATTENRGMGRVPELAKCLNNLGMVDYARGQWRRAAHTWDEFRVLCARVGDPGELASACNNLGFLYARLGQVERSALEFRRCIQLAEGAGFDHFVPVARTNLGEALMLAGLLDSADQAFAQAAAEFAAADAPHARIQLARHRAELRLLRGEADPARGEVRELLSDEGLEGEPDEVGHLCRVLSACERAVGQHDAAVEAAAQALAYFEEGGDRFEVAVCRETLAEALAANGNPFRGAHEAAAALDVYLALGARRNADRAAALHQSLLEATSVAAREVESKRALLEVAHSLGSTLDLPRLARLVLDKVVSIAEAERGLFALVDRNGELTHVVVQNLDWAGAGHPLPVSRSLVDRVLRSGQTVTVQDIETEADFGDRRSVRLLGLRSMAGIPVRHGDSVLGLLYVDSSTRTIGDVCREREVLEAFAALVGACVENARLFGELRFRAHLLAKMAHDFRAPLSVVKANADVMRMPGVSEDETDEMIDEIRASTLRMTRMIDDTLELARADAQAEADLYTIDLEDALEQHLESMSVLARQYEVDIILKRSGVRPRAQTRPDRVWIVVDNLVFNALKYAPPGSAVTVAVRLREDSGPVGPRPHAEDVGGIFRNDDRLHAAPEACFVEIAVHNGGRPIPDESMDKLFDAYHRDRNGAVGSVKSTGLGLAIVDQCVEHLGGCVWVRSDAETGTTFAFTLPQRVLDAEATPAVSAAG